MIYTFWSVIAHRSWAYLSFGEYKHRFIYCQCILRCILTASDYDWLMTGDWDKMYSLYLNRRYSVMKNTVNLSIDCIFLPISILISNTIWGYLKSFFANNLVVLIKFYHVHRISIKLNILIYFIVNRLQMKIINVQAKDYGDYICQGTNKLGIDEATVRLYGKLF